MTYKSNKKRFLCFFPFLFTGSPLSLLSLTTIVTIDLKLNYMLFLGEISHAQPSMSFESLTSCIGDDDDPVVNDETQIDGFSQRKPIISDELLFLSGRLRYLDLHFNSYLESLR